MLNLFAGTKDAHLWMTPTEPPGLGHAKQSLAAKDDPVVAIDTEELTPWRAARTSR